MSTHVNPAPPWLQLQFFDIAPVKDAKDLANSPAIFQVPTETAATASSHLGLLVADIHGSIHLLDSAFEPLQSWVAHVAGRVTHMVAREGILVTLGEEENSRMPLLKIWDIEHQDKKTGSPLLLRSVKVQHANRPHPVSTIALSNSLAYLAIGLADGTVLLYRHVSSSIQPNASLTSFPKPRTIHESLEEPITGLGFREPTDDVPHTYLFIVTLNRTLAYLASAKSTGAVKPSVIDEFGCELGCATMDWRGKEIVVARDDAIYLCGVDGRGSCFAVEGHKSSVQSHLNYLVIVSPPIPVSASHPSATVRNIAARSGPTADITKITVFDPDNKSLAFTRTFSEGVKAIFFEWGQIFILTNDGKLFRLCEKPTKAKLDILFQRSLYLNAINMAKTHELDGASLADIYRRYGDHLYSKGNYDGSMQQFIETLGHLQPSYVIRKFLDAQRIHNLTTYLQELHSRGLANSDHTTLLLNTYTKLKDVTRLDNFIKTESHRTASGNKNKELPFDLQTAIRVCRQAGYFDHASYLAKKYERHEDYLRIQIENTENYSNALEYVGKLGPEVAQSSLVRYGQALLAHLPDETTSLLIDICTGSDRHSEDPPRAPTPRNTTGPSYLSYLALSRTNAASGETASIAGTVTQGGLPSKTSDIPVHQASTSVLEGSRASSPHPSMLTARSAAPKLLSPRVFFAHFVDHTSHFIRFLETVALRRWGQSVDEAGISVGTSADDHDDQVAVWNTLLELYLSTLRASPETPDAPSSEEKILRLLKNPKLPYDSTHALIVCSTHTFTPGLVLLWEKMGMYEDALRFWMDKDQGGSDSQASGQVLRYLNLYGPTHPHLYPLVLRFLTSTADILSRHTADLKLILEHIDRERILPPLGIVQILSRNGVTSVGLVKHWLMTRIQESQQELQADRSLVESYRIETKANLQEIAELTDPDYPRPFQATRCSACSSPLDLPAVHFMCKHSYHQRCISENEPECSMCARSHALIREIRRNNERLADQHDLFLADVADKGFSAVASGFSRGVLSTPPEI